MYVYEAVYVLTVPELYGLLRENCIQMLVFEKKLGGKFSNNDVLRLLTVPIFLEGTKNLIVSNFLKLGSFEILFERCNKVFNLFLSEVKYMQNIKRNLKRNLCTYVNVAHITETECIT